MSQSDFVTRPFAATLPANKSVRPRHMSAFARFAARFRWRSALPRMAADFLIVHLAAILALVAAFWWQLTTDPLVSETGLATALIDYYRWTFVPLSFMFPVTFLLGGFYTRLRTYTQDYKNRVVFQGALLASVLFVFASFLLTRADLLPRSMTVFFSAFLITGTVGVRWLKVWMESSDTAAKERAEARPVRAADRAPVLVVGGAGYIGSILVRQLLESGRKVRVLDSLVYGSGAIRDVLEDPNLELIVGDCRNIQSVVSAVKGVDSIVHLAAIVGDPACEQDRQTALEINYAATRMLVEVAKGAGVRRFIFASSCSVYGASEELMDERSETSPISLYAQTKVQSEIALLEAASESFHPSILRLATVFGHSPRPRFDLVVNLLAAKAYQEGVITVYNGGQWRPFIHVQDVARGIVIVLNTPIPVVSGEIFNLGDSRLNHTLTRVAEKIRAAFPNTRIECVDNSDRRNYRVSFDKIRKMTGFQAEFTLEAGISELKAAFEDRSIEDYRDPLYSNQVFLKRTGSPNRTSEVDAYVMAAFARSWDGVGAFEVAKAAEQ